MDQDVWMVLEVHVHVIRWIKIFGIVLEGINILFLPEGFHFKDLLNQSLCVSSYMLFYRYRYKKYLKMQD